MAGQAEDDTVRVRRATRASDVARPAARTPARRGAWPWFAAGAALVAACALGAWSLTSSRAGRADVQAATAAPSPEAPAAVELTALAPPAPVPAPPVPYAPAPSAPAPAAPPSAAAIPVLVADEAAILARVSGEIAVFRMQPAPDILVLVFPTMHAQGRMLNRIGALVEKAGLPHDRVSGEAAIDDAIAASHVTADTYYSGHDYRASDLRRFFALARAEGAPLRPEEAWLEALLDREQCGAVISLSQGLDPPASATILRHELSHGLYFTSPAYAAYSRRFWERALTEDDRARFRAFLAAQDYDKSDEDLMLNETQAYLVHTADRRFFNAAAVGMTDARLNRLRGEFVRDMPPGWLRDRTPPLGLSATPPSAQRRPRRRAGQGAVSRTTARAVTLPPCRRRVSPAACNAAT